MWLMNERGVEEREQDLHVGRKGDGHEKEMQERKRHEREMQERKIHEKEMREKERREGDR